MYINKNVGKQNEFDFVFALNNKLVKDVNPLLNDLLHDLFPNIDDNMIVKAWCNNKKQKTDVFIKINGIYRGISIKMYNATSVHTEHIFQFVLFLLQCNIPSHIIVEYLKYHYADGTIDNTGKYRLSVNEYKEKYQNKINEINKYFNNEQLLNKVIDRFILKGNNSEYRTNAIVSGTPNNFVYILRDDVYKIIHKNFECNYTSPHFGSLVCQNESRNMNYRESAEHGRNYVKVKWYTLYRDIIDCMNDKAMNVIDV